MKKSLVAALLPTSSNTISTEFVAENNSFLLRSGNSDWLLTVLSTVCILCAGILYIILLLSVTVRSRYPTNYILMGIVKYVSIAGVFCLIVATVIILFVTSIELKFHLNHAFKKYYLIFDALTIWMDILLLYSQISAEYLVASLESKN
ncbi:unnamed protein product [Heterobilharzia americana]|nr:unnamed protein product [Heterobilharzia americana]